MSYEIYRTRAGFGADLISFKFTTKAEALDYLRSQLYAAYLNETKGNCTMYNGDEDDDFKAYFAEIYGEKALSVPGIYSCDSKELEFSLETINSDDFTSFDYDVFHYEIREVRG